MSLSVTTLTLLAPWLNGAPPLVQELQFPQIISSRTNGGVTSVWNALPGRPGPTVEAGLCAFPSLLGWLAASFPDTGLLPGWLPGAGTPLSAELDSHPEKQSPISLNPSKEKSGGPSSCQALPGPARPNLEGGARCRPLWCVNQGLHLDCEPIWALYPLPTCRDSPQA